MSHRGESSLGSIFIYLRFVVFLAAEMTLISRSRAAETPTLKPESFILIKAGRLMEGGRASSDRAAEDGGAAADQKRPGSEVPRQSHPFQGHVPALSRQSSRFQQESRSSPQQESHPGRPNAPPPGDWEQMEPQNLEIQLWPVTFVWMATLPSSGTFL